MLDIPVDHHSTVPPYEQLRQGIIARVRSGELTAGTKIPTVRALAAQLGLAPNTVARAYRELEQDGVLETRGRLGSFIASSGDPTRDVAGRAATEYVTVVRRLGLDDDTALGYIRAALNE
ncbi:GntR family transcriptional regulator [Nocardia terpenica]|uniref:GntR family transcriptional regulator n=1 Tax=Nocardia terpenica TaxID=455432 RepID=A0A164KYX2_9NOCA|nr:GntR family transcriptional regulator [Nocardia terpenica]ATL70586.1 GntR family transcriptional regulator [Nocardia terpenica]KZM71863.1 GntR family transcriptional regulator [Nocardia terpenica]MBF6060572.1 GntR family transcriptional regulator [Nocardia terpenica]MBF6103832.1 GntR family transcriptional regulator [Nocardia terpenica]MBF6111794.1 GntR family transcriptional regulator [Nocardia terpenica]